MKKDKIIQIIVISPEKLPRIFGLSENGNIYNKYLNDGETEWKLYIKSPEINKK